jgi:hypothetical protein
MLNVLNQNLRRRIEGLWKRPGLSTAATLTLALGIGVASVILSWLFATFGPMRYPKAVGLVASNATSDSEQTSRSPRLSSPLRAEKSTLSPERRRPLDEDRSARNSESPNQPQPSPTRRRVPGSAVCSAARATRSRMQRQQNRTARCVQTGVGGLEHLPNAQDTDITIRTREKSCTV